MNNTLQHGALFGPFSRYQLVRHDSHRGQDFSCWMVLDAERPDELTGYPGVIRQAATVADAVAGLTLLVCTDCSFTFGGLDESARISSAPGCQCCRTGHNFELTCKAVA